MIFITFTANLHDDPGQYKVTFAPGVTRVLLDAQIIDQIISENKYYKLIINHSLLLDDVTTYYPDKALLIAFDNCKCLYCHMCIKLYSLGAHGLPVLNIC